MAFRVALAGIGVNGIVELWRWLTYTEALSTNWSQNNNWWYGAEHYFTYPFTLTTVHTV